MHYHDIYIYHIIAIIITIIFPSYISDDITFISAIIITIIFAMSDRKDYHQ